MTTEEGCVRSVRKLLLIFEWFFDIYIYIYIYQKTTQKLIYIYIVYKVTNKQNKENICKNNKYIKVINV